MSSELKASSTTVSRQEGFTLDIGIQEELMLCTIMIVRGDCGCFLNRKRFTRGERIAMFYECSIGVGKSWNGKWGRNIPTRPRERKIGATRKNPCCAGQESGGRTDTGKRREGPLQALAAESSGQLLTGEHSRALRIRLTHVMHSGCYLCSVVFDMYGVAKDSIT